MSTVELLEILRRTDEVALLELLELTSDDLVDMFMDLIVENENKIRKAVED